jgi:hypothetical protein
MGLIRIPLRFEGSVGEKNVYALFDNRATFSFLRYDIANEIEVPSKLRRPLEVATASEGHYIKIEEAIIGVNTLQKWRIKLNFENDTVEIDPKVAKLILKALK